MAGRYSDEEIKRFWQYLEGIGADDDAPVFEPARVQKLSTVPALPGKHYAGRALAEGCEDAWAGDMEAKYGGEW